MTTSTTDGVSTESPALPDAFERDLPWLVLSGGAAVVVYVAYLATHPYPAFGAGLFFRAAEEVAAAGYGLPTRIDGYTADGVPFAYPPLPFYVLAVALEAGLDPVAVSRYLPGLLVVAALAPYYYAAKGLLGSVPKAGLATVLLAVAPTVLRWHLSAGGVVRALAFALVAIGLYAGVRLFRMEPRPARWLSRTRWRWLALATTAFGLTVLSHPIYAVFFGVSYLVLFWFGDRSLGGLATGAVVAVGGLALAAPWWLPVISVHGVEVFAGTAGTHGGLGGRPHRIGAAFLAPLVPDAETPFFLAAYAGAAYLLYRREYRLPAWLLVAGYVVGKGRFLFVPGAMTAAVLVFDWLLPRVAGARAATPSGRLPNPAASLVLALVVLVATGVGGLAAAGQLSIWHGGPSQPAFVDDHDRAAMAWASEHTGPDATYVVLGDAAEWFPLLADRPILVGHWGTEWEGAGEYRRQLARYRTVSACDTERCVTAELDGAGLRPDYVYVPKGRYSIRGEVRRAPPGLVETMADAGRYELVYGNGGVAVFRLTPRSDRDGHAPRTPLKSNGTERDAADRGTVRNASKRPRAVMGPCDVRPWRDAMNLGRALRQMRRGGSEGRDDAIHLRRDELFELLADSRRRLVVERLARDDRDPPTCRELAVEIAAKETHMAAEQVPRRRVEPVEDDLRAEHLPGLVEAGLVRWDGGTGEVRPGHSVGAVAGLLDEVDRRVRPAPATPAPSWRAGEPIDARETARGPVR